VNSNLEKTKADLGGLEARREVFGERINKTNTARKAYLTKMKVSLERKEQILKEMGKA
jgi:hypothetical protein